MPLVKSFSREEEVASAADECLFNDGKLTLEGKIVRDFLKEVDMDPLFDVPEIQEGITRRKTTGIVVGDTLWEAFPPNFKKGKKKDKDDDDEDDEEDDEEDDDDDDDDDEADESEEESEVPEPVECEVEVMSGELAASVIDEDDMYGMFIEYVTSLPTGTLEERLNVQSIARYFEESDVENLDEFAKGDFRKIRKGAKKTKNGLTGPGVVKSMLIAMMHKHAIKRAKAPGGYTPRGAGSPGSGYKGGDYEKDPAGYGAGTSAGRKTVFKFKKGHKSEIEKRAKKVKGYAKAKAAKAKAAKGKPKMVAQPKATKQRGKAAEIAKKKPTPRGARQAGRPQAQVAHDDNANSNLTEGRDPYDDACREVPVYEGAALAAQIIKRNPPLTEAK